MFDKKTSTDSNTRQRYWDTPLPPWIAASAPIRALAAGYGAVTGLRNALYGRLPALSCAAGRRVISVGGIRAGGTGKTPLAIYIGKYILAKGRAVAFLSRGYRRGDKRPRLVAPGEHVSWELIGDEPWLLHNAHPQTWLGIAASRRRSAAALAAILPPHAVFVLDDGFQHRGLRRDLDIVCLHERALDDRMIPAGYLREPIRGLQRAHAAIIIGSHESADACESARSKIQNQFPALSCGVMLQEPGLWTNAANGQTAAVPPLERPVLVCGIARPKRFTSLVRNTGITPCTELIFPDHHRYITNDFNKTRELYSNGIVTTAKDAVRLKNLGVVPNTAIWYLTIDLRFASEADEKRFGILIDKVIS